MTIPNTVNPFPQTGGAFITVPIPIYPVYTPENSASGSIDYEAPMKGYTLRFHLDGNYDSGYYANYTDVTYDPVTRAVRYPQVKGDAAFVVNGRIAVADIGMGNSGAKVTISAWARNLFNEQHLFYKDRHTDRRHQRLFQRCAHVWRRSQCEVLNNFCSSWGSNAERSSAKYHRQQIAMRHANP